MTRVWSINGRFLGQPITGVQRYAHEVVNALDILLGDGHPLAQGLEVELVAPAGTPPPPALRAIRWRPVGSRLRGQAWEQGVLPFAVRGGLISLCNTAPLALGRQIVCIHDANTRVAPQSYSLAFRTLYRVLHPLLGRRARQVTTVSRHSATELARYGIAAPSRIMIAGNGHEHVRRWRPPFPASMRPGPDTIVVLSSPAPHKNVGLILALAPKLAEAGLRIAVVGASNARVFRSSDRVRAAANIAWLGRIDDDQLAGLLRGSLCLAFPSLAEGFGLPALEAMALGCPVVASNCSSLPEVCGNAALYAPPRDADAWHAHFLRLKDDPRLRAELLARGLARAQAFTWRRTAEVYLEVMARVDGLISEERAVDSLIPHAAE
jgi:glycosyltransferase involved in cell wall biosynthesis